MRLDEIESTGSIKREIRESIKHTNKDNVGKLIECLSKLFREDINEEHTECALLAIVEHVRRGVPLYDTIFRTGSEAHLYSVNLARKLHESNIVQFSGINKELIESDLGKFDKYMNEDVPLDLPMVTEAEYQGKKVELNKPKRGGSKAYHVYVKDPKTGNVKKVNFGSGMKAKLNDPEAKKAYNARHGCSKGKHNDKTKAGYWSCRLPRWKSLGLSGSGTWW